MGKYKNSSVYLVSPSDQSTIGTIKINVAIRTFIENKWVDLNPEIDTFSL
jgi:hypothetical protein